jgi:membrane protein implicated in regulation of membrane protease activity
MAGSDTGASHSMSRAWVSLLVFLASFAAAVSPALIWPSTFTAFLVPIISGAAAMFWRYWRKRDPRGPHSASAHGR